MVTELFTEIDSDTLSELWPNYLSDEKKIENIVTTNIGHANIGLNSILTDEEKVFLERQFFDEDGWYKRINGEGMIRLKLAAMALKLTNNVFTFNPDAEDRIKERIKNIPVDEQILAAKCYMKQKVVTYATMRNYLQKVKKTPKMSITLYRGIPGKYYKEKYLHLGLECWTTNIDAAVRFTEGDGYVLHKEYSITDMFAGNRSTFKNKPNNIYRNNGFYVRREHEIIVENIEREFIMEDNVQQIIDGEFV